MAAAAEGLGLSLSYCAYLAKAAASAIAAATDTTNAELPQQQPHTQITTAFAVSWHAGSLARLADTDLVQVWRLLHYLLVDDPCLALVRDVAVQRHIRAGCTLSDGGATGLVGMLRQLESFTAADDVDVCMRVACVCDLLDGACSASGIAPSRLWRLAAAVDVPTTPAELEVAAFWGQRASVLKVGTSCLHKSECVAAAVFGGHLNLVRWLVDAHCPWDASIMGTLIGWYHPAAEAMLVCLVEATLRDLWGGNAQAFEYDCLPRILSNAACYGRLAVLRWADREDLLLLGDLRGLHDDVTAQAAGQRPPYPVPAWARARLPGILRWLEDMIAAASTAASVSRSKSRAASAGPAIPLSSAASHGTAPGYTSVASAAHSTGLLASTATAHAMALPPLAAELLPCLSASQVQQLFTCLAERSTAPPIEAYLVEWRREYEEAAAAGVTQFRRGGDWASVRLWRLSQNHYSDLV
jgi:hypothetical protein